MYELVIQMDGAAIEYDAKRCVLRVTMRGLMESATYRELNVGIAGFAKRHPVIAIISNLRHSGLVSPADQAWVAEHILPQLVDCGLHFTAFVLPSNVYAEVSLQTFSQHMGQAGPVYQRYVGSLSDAEAWVNAVLLTT